MKRKTIVTCIILVTFFVISSCSKEGPIGPEGPAGPSGSALTGSPVRFCFHLWWIWCSGYR